MRKILSVVRTSPKPDHGRKGFLLLEAVLSIALFAIFMGAFGITIYEGQGQTKAGGDRKRGVDLTVEALEGVRAIAAKDFLLLTPGTHGVKVNAVTGQWSLDGASQTATGGYVTSVTLSAAGTNILARAVTTWNRSPTRPQSVTMYTMLSNWRTTRPVGNWGGAALTPIATYTYDYAPGVDPGFSDVAVTGSSAFLTSTNASYPGLTIVDLPHLNAPEFENTKDIGGVGYAMAVRSDVLYVLTSDADAEIKAYDISTPGSPSLLATYNLPGSGAARAIAVDGDFLYVGATGLGPATSLPQLKASRIANALWKPGVLSWLMPSALATYCYFAEDGMGYCCRDPVDGYCPGDPNYPSSSSVSSVAASSSSSLGPYPNGDDFFSFDISNDEQITFLDSVYVGGVKGIALSGTSAYLATTVDAKELHVIDITNPTQMSIEGWRDGGSAQDGLTTAVGPSTLLLGIQNTAAPANGNGRARIFDLPNSGMPSTLAGPWNYTSSGSTLRIATDPTACYAFIASDWFQQSLQVVRINPSSSPTLLQSWMPLSDSGNAASLFYEPGLNRLFVATSKRMDIFAPAAGNSVCP